MCRAALLVLALVFSWTGLSRADAVTPDVYACGSLSLGSSCKTGNGVTGTCQDSTCYQKDLSHWDRDAGGYPPTIPVACLKCVSKDSGTDTDDDSKDSSGCSISGTRMIAPWLFAGIFAVGVSLLRRRPRR
jgi:hypothetical protein